MLIAPLLADDSPVRLPISDSTIALAAANFCLLATTADSAATSSWNAASNAAESTGVTFERAWVNQRFDFLYKKKRNNTKPNKNLRRKRLDVDVVR